MTMIKTSKLLIIVLTVTLIALAGLTWAAVTINQTIPSSGTITAGPNVGIYSSNACTSAVTSISWGSVEAGGSATQTIYVEDTGGAQMAPSITVGSWSPSAASGYIAVTWTTLPAEIQPGVSGAIAVSLTVTVSSSITGITSFSNAITIAGTG